MKKRILAILCTAAILLSLAGCSDTATSSVADSGTGSSVTESSKEDSTTDSSTAEENSSAVEDVKYELGKEVTPGMISKSRLNEGNKVRLAKVIKKLQAGEEVTVGFIGGSITQGVSAGNDLCYAKLTANYLQEAFPNAKVNYVNAGIGATGSYIGVHRVTDDLLTSNPDLVFVEFSVNDTTQYTARNKNSYDGLLRTIWNYSTNPAIITLATTQEDGTSFQQYHAEIVKAYDLPMISYRDAILEVIGRGDIAWKDISDDNIHPNVAGHKVVSQLLQSYIADVTADVDNISGDESDFSTPATENTFENGKLIRFGSEGVTTSGSFEGVDTDFGGFKGVWRAKGGKGDFGDSAITFEVTAKSIGLLYGKTTTGGCYADVYVDDKLITSINTDFTGGWGSYVECESIIKFENAEKHIVKIVPRAIEEGKSGLLNITALAVS